VDNSLIMTARMASWAARC